MTTTASTNVVSRAALCASHPQALPGEDRTPRHDGAPPVGGASAGGSASDERGGSGTGYSSVSQVRCLGGFGSQSDMEPSNSTPMFADPFQKRGG